MMHLAFCFASWYWLLSLKVQLYSLALYAAWIFILVWKMFCNLTQLQCWYFRTFEANLILILLEQKNVKITILLGMILDISHCVKRQQRVRYHKKFPCLTENLGIRPSKRSRCCVTNSSEALGEDQRKLHVSPQKSVWRILLKLTKWWVQQYYFLCCNKKSKVNNLVLMSRVVKTNFYFW